VVIGLVNVERRGDAVTAPADRPPRERADHGVLEETVHRVTQGHHLAEGVESSEIGHVFVDPPSTSNGSVNGFVGVVRGASKVVAGRAAMNINPDNGVVKVCGSGTLGLDPRLMPRDTVR
jgi:hypothetical protein